MNASDSLPTCSPRAGAQIRASGVRSDGGFRTERQGCSVVAAWVGLGTLRASLDGKRVEVVPDPGLDPILEEKWRRGAVRALIRHLQRRPTLHASAIALRGAGICFLGDSGAGKSTCAADLCNRLGAELLSDDLAEIDCESESLVISPADASHWLHDDSATAMGFGSLSDDKHPRRARRVATRAAPLRALVALTFGEIGSHPMLSPLRGVGAFLALNAAYTRFIVDDDAIVQGDLHGIADLVRKVPTFTLCRPRSFDALPAATALIAELAEQFADRSVAR